MRQCLITKSRESTTKRNEKPTDQFNLTYKLVPKGTVKYCNNNNNNTNNNKRICIASVCRLT